MLGDLPVVGNLFKARQEERTRRTLFVFLRPTILRDPTAAGQVTQGKYDRLKADEAGLQRNDSLLLHPPGPRLTVEISGIY